jgi:hypothetical protein
MEKLINWSELSRIITGNRNGIRFKKIPKKHIEALDKLLIDDIPKWWREYKMAKFK